MLQNSIPYKISIHLEKKYIIKTHAVREITRAEILFPDFRL